MCTRCVMDTTDPEISFDENGHCNHCRRFFNEIKDVRWLPNEKGKEILENLLAEIKEEGKRKEYDGIIGLSGGVDSSYLLCKIREWGLRPLAVHVDAGWNTELAVKNIEVLCRKLDVDLHTIVIDWESMRDAQVAFLRSGIANQDIPQDHAFFAALYRYAVKHGVQYVFHGSNFATESILPTSWGQDAMDARFVKGIFKRFGNKNMKKYPLVNFWEYYIYYPYIKKMQVVRPLNYIPYRKDEAIMELEKFGWRYYGAKHWESRFTKFFQGYYLAARFGYDKRKAHLSSLIVSGEITRDVAMEELQKPIYPQDQLQEDRLYILKKMGIEEEEFQKLLYEPINELNIPTYKHLRDLGRKVKKVFSSRG